MNAEVRTRSYEVSCLPEDSVNNMAWALTVDYRGNDLWAVKHGGQCLDSDGEWDYEPMPSNRTDEWIATHRFNLTRALLLAKEAAPLVRVNGKTAAEVLEWENSQ